MSLRQLRKLGLQGPTGEYLRTNSAAAEYVSSGESSNNDTIREHAACRRSVFLQAVGSDFQVSGAESDGDGLFQRSNDPGDHSSPDNSSGETKPQRTSSGIRKRRRRKPSGAARPQEGPLPSTDSVNEVETAVNDDASALSETRNDSGVSSCLYMERSAFDPETDLRRVFGREVLRNARASGRGGSGGYRTQIYIYSLPSPNDNAKGARGIQ